MIEFTIKLTSFGFKILTSSHVIEFTIKLTAFFSHYITISCILLPLRQWIAPQQFLLYLSDDSRWVVDLEVLLLLVEIVATQLLEWPINCFILVCYWRSDLLAILEQHWFFTDRWYHHVWYSVCLSFLELVGSFEGSNIPTLEFTVYSDFQSKLGLETSWVLEPRICGEIMQIAVC